MTDAAHAFLADYKDTGTVVGQPSEAVMAPTALQLKEKTQLIQNETVSLELIQVLLTTTFSCVGYLRQAASGKIRTALHALATMARPRDLFDESCFEDHQIAEMSLKKFKRGISLEADTLLDWLEKGCFDAITNKYLRMVVFGIYLDPDCPYDMVETYTFKVAYPSVSGGSGSELESQMTSLSIEQNDRPILKFSQHETDFRKSVVKILRTLCIMTQTLKALPQDKYLTMKLFYYDERTPANYQPPCFKESPSEDVSSFTFESKPLKLDFGTASTPFHAINVKIQTISDSLKTSHYGPPRGIPSQPSLGDVSTIHPMSPQAESQPSQLMNDTFANSLTIMSQAVEKPFRHFHLPEVNTQLPSPLLTAQTELKTGDGSVKLAEEKASAIAADATGKTGSPSSGPMALHNIVSDMSAAINEVIQRGCHVMPIVTPASVSTSASASVSAPAPTVASSDNGRVACLCGCNQNDLDMIFCDRCQHWQHTVCAGFYSNKDKRLLATDYLCYGCRFSNHVAVAFLKSLCAFRRALSIVFHEGLTGSQHFSQRLGVALHTSQTLIDRLLREQFITRTARTTDKNGVVRRWDYQVMKGNEIRKKIKSYFDTPVEKLPEIAKALNIPEHVKPLMLSREGRMAESKPLLKSVDPMSKPSLTFHAPPSAAATGGNGSNSSSRRSDKETSAPNDLSLAKVAACKRRKVSISEKRIDCHQ